MAMHGHAGCVLPDHPLARLKVGKRASIFRTSPSTRVLSENSNGDTGSVHRTGDIAACVELYVRPARIEHELEGRRRRSTGTPAGWHANQQLYLNYKRST